MNAIIPSDNENITKEEPVNPTPNQTNKNHFTIRKTNLYYVIVSVGALIWFAQGVQQAFWIRNQKLKDWPESAYKNLEEETNDENLEKPSKIAPFMVLHFLGSGPLLLAGLWNLYFTPGTLETVYNLPKKIHIYVGRVGLFLGIVLGCIGGFLHVWTDPFQKRAFAIGLSVVGALQITFTILMLLPIKKAQKLGREIEELETNKLQSSFETDNLGSETNGWILDASMLIDLQKKEKRLEQLKEEREMLIQTHKCNATALFYGTCVGPLWFRVFPSLIALFQGVDYEDVDENFIFVGLIPHLLVGLKVARIRPGQWF